MKDKIFSELCVFPLCFGDNTEQIGGPKTTKPQSSRELSTALLTLYAFVIFKKNGRRNTSETEAYRSLSLYLRFCFAYGPKLRANQKTNKPYLAVFDSLCSTSFLDKQRPEV